MKKLYLKPTAYGLRIKMNNMCMCSGEQDWRHRHHHNEPEEPREPDPFWDDYGWNRHHHEFADKW